MPYTKLRILLLSVFLEGILVAIFALWVYFNGQNTGSLPKAEHFFYSIVACIPLFVLNFSLFGPWSNRVSFLRSCFEFKEKVVKPLADQLNAFDSLVVACCAGFGEELFFRGVLQNEIGLFLSSILFSVLHFGTSIFRYLFIGIVYTIIGVYFGLLYRYFDTLWVPILTHSIYDYFALLYMRYWYQPMIPAPHIPSAES